ncbi:hypothetical protein DS745_20450 [Anaerobacillus alkaliphilus]|uniref:Uncharacterized protein n=2 Tax=Anaerobacillus alkaliphilus TaxID=1548597 RepID=A0A4Q0VRR9_9BACI|nr:hypothetical protein DS745_20450 [Anaerobacillus alkaliphilus]
MYLTEANINELIKKQYLYKLRAHYGIFTSLLLTQIAAIAFSFMGSGSMGTGSNGFSINVTFYTGNVIIAFTMLWAFISGVSMNSRLVREGDFSFVTNRLTSNLSNIAFMLTATTIGGICAMLGSSLIKTIMYFLGANNLVSHSFAVPLNQLLTGVITTVLYVSLFGILGYVVAGITQLSRIFVILLPVGFVGLIFLEARTGGGGLLVSVTKFFATETSLLILALKVVFVISGLCFLTVLISNKQEVRR